MLFSGVVGDIRFKKELGSFYIISVKSDGGEWITAKGSIPGVPVRPGSWICFDGDMTVDKKYGEQVQIKKAPVIPGSISSNGIMNILISEGKSDIALLISGLEIDLDTLKDDEKLSSIGLEDSLINNIRGCVKSVLGGFSYPSKLRSLGIPDDKIDKVVSLMGSDIIERIKENPWILSKFGILKIPEIDKIAENLGVVSPINRLSGIIITNMRNWCVVDTYIESREFLNRVVLLTGEEVKNISEAVNLCVKNGDLVVDKTTRPGVVAIYQKDRFDEEEYTSGVIANRSFDAKDRVISSVLREVNKKPDHDLLPNIDDLLDGPVLPSETDVNHALDMLIEEESKKSGMELDELQSNGIKNCIKYPVSILTGLPGTGKSTSVKVLTSLLRRLGSSFMMMAPTGVAAKRLNKITGHPALTIHKGLGAEVGMGEADKDKINFVRWKFDELNPLGKDVVIVDESSMIDQYILDKLIRATSSKNSRLVFVGDSAQLPSVGYGNVLMDMINSGKVPTTQLTRIYRQNEGSSIINASHSVYYGRTPKCEGDFHIIELETEIEICDKILDIIEKNKDDKTWQVLSPRYAGTVGVDNLNHIIREEINPVDPVKPSLKLGDMEIRLDDRVMVIKNNYQLGVCNGDVGKVTDIDHKGKKVKVLIDNETNFCVDIAYRDVPHHLKLSYACTVHKYQGMEIDVIIMPLINGFAHQLQRNLLYTAITRAKQEVYIVGSMSALSKAVVNNKEEGRKTLLSDRIKANNVKLSGG